MIARFAALAAALVLASWFVAPMPGLAAGGQPIIVVDDGARGPDDSATQSTAGVCILEPAPLDLLNYVLALPDVYTSFAWRIPFSSCTACPAPQTLQINSVTIRIRWFSVCSAQAQVSIVGATGPSTCRVPDPTNVRCGPAMYTISGIGQIGATHTLPLPSGCCVSGEAFALVRFTGFDLCAGPTFGPGIYRTTAACVNCDEFISSSVTYPPGTDWCAVFPPPPILNSLWMQVDADCCIPTGIGSHSWGTIKTLYR